VATADVAVRVQPRARRTEVVGERGGRIVVRVTAPPVDGRANDAVCALVAERAGVPAGRVAVVRGHTARDKTVRVQGVEADALRRALLGPG
jgi:uncharacterized protein (TIGR00251 family)